MQNAKCKTCPSKTPSQTAAIPFRAAILFVILINLLRTSAHPNNSYTPTSIMTYEQDGAEAREIAKYLPYFPFKGIPRFYDIGGFLEKPEVFQQIVDIFVKRYEEIGIDSVAG
jgi:hypothetical protein